MDLSNQLSCEEITKGQKRAKKRGRKKATKRPHSGHKKATFEGGFRGTWGEGKRNRILGPEIARPPPITNELRENTPVAFTILYIFKASYRVVGFRVLLNRADTS